MMDLRSIDYRLSRWKRAQRTAFGIADAYAWNARNLDDPEEARHFGKLARRQALCARQFRVSKVTPDPDHDAPYIRVSSGERRCLTRLCPLCSHFHAANTRRLVNAAFDHILATTHRDFRCTFTTLTMKNEPIANTASMFATFEWALKSLMGSTRFKKSNYGFLVALEIPVRRTQVDSHTGLMIPQAGLHCHGIALVDDQSFTSNTYLTHAELQSWWKTLLGVTYTPQVRITAVKAESHLIDPNDAVKGAIREVVKYATAPISLFHLSGNDILLGNTELAIDPVVVRHLTKALYRRRLLRSDRLWAEGLKQARQAKTA